MSYIPPQEEISTERDNLCMALIEYKEILQKRIFDNGGEWSKEHRDACCSLGTKITELYLIVKDF